MYSHWSGYVVSQNNTHVSFSHEPSSRVDETNNYTGEPQEVLFSGDNIETDEHQCGFSRDDVKRRFKAIIMSISLYKWRVC